MKKIKYTDTMAQKILNFLSSGKTLVDVQGKGLPSRWTIYQWFVDNPEFEKLYRLAQECNADSKIEKVIHRIETCQDTKQAKLLDVLFKSTSWYVAKINSKYKDRVDVSVSHTLDISPALNKALTRLSALSIPAPVPAIEAEAVVT
jgi:hypothetical protein|tara:strand:+ start:577 stop:1014 length:438 start_codon:yes stop_codon:yes gene_type:complete